MTMPTFAQEWTEYDDECLAGRDEIPIEDLRMTFYAGAWIVFRLLDQARRLETEEACNNAIDAVVREIDDWIGGELVRRRMEAFGREHAN